MIKFEDHTTAGTMDRVLKEAGVFENETADQNTYGVDVRLSRTRSGSIPAFAPRRPHAERGRIPRVDCLPGLR